MTRFNSKYTGELTKKIRERLKLTQRAFAVKIGTSQTGVSFIELGEVVPDYMIYIKIANIGKITLDKLLREKVKNAIPKSSD